MNIIRTIQREEDPRWVKCLFESGPHRSTKWSTAPAYPPLFPLPIRLQNDCSEGFFYLLYRGQLVGFARIARIYYEPTATYIGSTQEWIGPGDRIILRRKLKRMPETLKARGFTGIRYTDVALQKATKQAAQHALDSTLGVSE